MPLGTSTASSMLDATRIASERGKGGGRGREREGGREGGREEEEGRRRGCR